MTIRVGVPAMRIIPGIILLMTTAATPETVSFAGTVTSGEHFEHEVAEGLLFLLHDLGSEPGCWLIEMVEPDHPTDDFCGVVTPPYRGINALHLFAWHFLSADGTGLNQGDVNAPGEVREFRFVTCREDLLDARESLEGMLWPVSTESQEAAVARHDSIPTGEGTLIVTDLRWSEAGYFPETVELDFEVELVFPDETVQAAGR
jgi:hypothetical protein